MFASLAKRVFGSANDRFLKGLQSNVAAINTLEPEFEALSDEDLRARTAAFRQRVAAGQPLDDLLIEAFATVREAAKRTLGQRHFDVQLMGGMVLHQGMISEMKTGEGKTLVATLAVYLNALGGQGVHVVTVNDYLAQRDSQWMGQIYEFLGLSVGCIVHGLSDDERRAAYACDVTYGTNNEFGFDYLRDNMKFQLEDMVQRDFNFAIVDEVDSILVDEARTPLIISGPAEDSSEMYIKINTVIPHLEDEHYEKDEKQRTVALTDAGTESVEALLRADGILTDGTLYDIENVNLVHHVNQALRAHKLFQRDTDYIVKDARVVIIDEFTGRMMEGRRYSEGLHQALEAKEGVPIQQENQTLASITFQNYFRLYPKLGGMTGTAMTEAAEFADIYKLEVIEIPTNLPCIRIDSDDEVYRTAQEKYDAILEVIQECQGRKQPVLVGTVSIEKSETLSAELKKRKIKHQVLNARYHEQEAYIIAQAGTPGTVTIATNMAGRGTDIQLGGNLDMRIRQEAEPIQDETARNKKIEKIKQEIGAARAVALNGGGLMIIGTERHESRRIDNQLRGRGGRQGDPGASRFFLSLEDDLMRIFGSDRMESMLRRLGLQDGEAIVHRWVNKALEKAQQKVEARNFEIRKNLLKYDDVMNDQRKVVYEQRKDLMRAEEVHEAVIDMRQQLIEDLVARHIPEGAYAEQWDGPGLHAETVRIFGLELPIDDWLKEEGIADQEIRERLEGEANRRMAAKTANYGEAVMRSLEKQILLMVLDKQWKDHLLSLDHLRHGIVLRAYGQRDPLNEYKREAFELFEHMLAEMRDEVTMLLARVELRAAEPEAALVQRSPQEMRETRLDPAFAGAGAGAGDGLGEPMAEAMTEGDGGVATAVRPTARGGARPAAARAGARPVSTRQAAAEIDKNDPSTWGRVPRNAPCPCGSGRKYKHCHGRLAR